MVVAAVLLMGYLAIGHSRTASAASLGQISFRVTATSTADAVSFASNDTDATDTVGIVVTDADLAGAGTITVGITSDSDATGFTMTLTELSAGSESFGGTLTISTTTATTTLVIGAEHDDAVTATYTDLDSGFGTLNIPVSLTVDAEGPKLEKILPENGTITNAETQTFSIEISDEDSGVDETVGGDTALTSISFLINQSEDSTTTAGVAPIFDISDVEENEQKVGVKVERNFNFVGEVWVSAKAKDVAGNETIYDDDTTEAGDQMAKVTIDKTDPAIDEAFTGVGYDSKDEVLTFDNADKILVLFDVGLADLDPASVDKSDFAVSGFSVDRADMFDGDPVSSTERGIAELNLGAVVVLTLTTDMAPDSAPKVTLIGDGIDDVAGNSQTSGEEDPVDKVAPTITIDSITPELAGEDDAVVIKISADEELDADPTVTVKAFDDGAVGSTLSITLVSDGTNKWQVTTADIADTTSFNIYVTGGDGEGNVGTAGVADNTDEDDGDAFMFEGDTELPVPLVTPAEEDEPVTRDPFFIIVDFGATSSDTGLEPESGEYDGDGSATVTLTKLEIDGESALAVVSTQDDTKFLVAISEIADGEHTVTVNARDVAGNVLEDDLEITFTVIQKPSTDIPVSPGWNLISFPGDPESTAINDVIPADHDIDQVLSYDPHIVGGWLVAERGDDGLFAGTLTSLTGNRGYFVQSSSFVPLSVDVGALTPGQQLLPPGISLKAGWNLVAVVDPSGDLAAGDEIDALDYFGSVEPVRVFRLDQEIGRLTSVDVGSGSTDTVSVGEGYWVYMDEDDVLVP